MASIPRTINRSFVETAKSSERSSNFYSSGTSVCSNFSTDTASSRRIVLLREERRLQQKKIRDCFKSLESESRVFQRRASKIVSATNEGKYFSR